MKSAKCLSKTRQQHSLLRWLIAGLGLFTAKNAFAAEYYVSPTGSDSGAGPRRRRLPRFRRQTTPPRQGIPSGCVPEPTTARVRSHFRRAEHRTPIAPRSGHIQGEVPITARLLELLIGQRVVGQASNHRDRELDASEGQYEIANGEVGQWLPLLLHVSHQECEQQHLRAAQHP